MNIGKQIYELRKQKGIKQEELAAELGVTAAAVSKWEKGYTLPDILMLCALADYFMVTTDELLGRCKAWNYVVIAAENEALAHRIAALARRYGLAHRGVFTDYQSALEAARDDEAVKYLIAGFYTGFYEGNIQGKTLVCVNQSDDEILNGLELLLKQFQ